MERFAQLIDALDGSSGSKRKVELLRSYLAEVAPDDGSWSLTLLLGERRKRLITGRRLREILQASTSLPDWLFEDCHSHVGDSAETVALLWPQLREQLSTPPSLDNADLAHLLHRAFRKGRHSIGGWSRFSLPSPVVNKSSSSRR